MPDSPHAVDHSRRAAAAATLTLALAVGRGAGGKRSIVLDLSRAPALAAFRRLLAAADVLITNVRLRLLVTYQGYHIL